MSYELIDPFKVSISIASLASYTFRKGYLQPETIPLILDKNCGAIGLRQQSNIALKYLSWLVQTKHPNLKYAGNGPEYRIANYRVDGFDPDSNTIIEVFGDVIHSCPIHTDSELRHPLKPHLTNGDVFDNSMVKILDLQNMNYSVKIIWECEIMEKLKGNEEMKKWFEHRNKWKDLIEPIGARDALHGGRVEAFVLLLELNEEMIGAGWRINYLDVVSLYPFVQSDPQFYYPTSHPTIINGCQLSNEGEYVCVEELEKYFGIVSATCYGPSNLLIPVLPLKHADSGRLVFPLCGPCSLKAENDTDTCGHYGEERAFRGCWTSPELIRAVQLGYTIVKVHQIWHFDRKSNTIFREYVRTWSKLKYAASGWPDECQTDYQKEEFLLELKQKYEIILTKEEIKKNIPLRTLCKHFLNNLWGKLSTRLDRTGRNVEFIATEQELVTIMKDDRKDLIALGALTDKYAIVETSLKDQFQFSAFHNPVLAAFVTSYARLILLEHLHRVPDQARIIYTDTDSIVYLANVNEEDPYRHHRGNFLGMLKNEMEHPDDYIVRWVSLGSKNYSYETAHGQLVHRSKGLVIPESVSDQFKFNLVKAILLKDSKTIGDFYENIPDRELSYRLQEDMFQNFPNSVGVLLPQPLITRNFKKNEDVTTCQERTKFLRFCFTKRKLIDNKLQPEIVCDISSVRLRSIPWGYKYI